MEKFKEFQSEVENHCNKKIKFLRSDRGGEYLSYEFAIHLKLLGNAVFQKKIPTITQDLSRRCIATRGESVSTYPHRPKEEAFVNAVNVVELLLVPTNQAPNVRHLPVMHTFNSVTSLVLLI